MIKFKFPTAAVDELGKRLENYQRGLDAEEARQVGRGIVENMKRIIAAGSSPIRGSGIAARFAAYKDPAKYPGKRKPSSPVNLKLSGDFLKDLGYIVKSGRKGYVAEVGYSTDKSIAKESGHREGVNGQPSRPTIPDYTRGEDFASSVIDAYRKVILAAFRRR